MKETIKIVIMTSNGLRHRYFANSLATQFNVVDVVSETRKSSDEQSEARFHYMIYCEKEK